MQRVGLVCTQSTDGVGLSLSLLKIFIQNHETLLTQQCCTMLASFELLVQSKKI
jgi:nitrogen-specific signal transduction histidine kinase